MIPFMCVSRNRPLRSEIECPAQVPPLCFRCAWVAAHLPLVVFTALKESAAALKPLSSDSSSPTSRMSLLFSMLQERRSEPGDGSDEELEYEMGWE
eukprot:m.311669 g.311669  ORF g.311669 m.311669 type:complete len:96 (-) comp55367_c0_seq2:928-1215(-)